LTFFPEGLSFRAKFSSWVKEGNDYGYELDDKAFLKELWEEIESEPIINIRYVFEDYISYHESTDSEEDKDLMSKSLKSLEVVTSQHELELLINVWMYYDPTDYPDIKEVYRILEKSKPQSIAALKDRIVNKRKWEASGSAPYADLKDLLKQLESKN
jgi:hypothetical protein